MGTRAVTPDDWDHHWDRYAESASLNPAQTMRHELVLRALRTLGRPIERLLDVGSGQGDFLVRATREGAANDYAGIELSESGVRVARTKLPQVTFLQVDLYRPGPEAERLHGWGSAAVCSDVIEHVDEPVTFLRAARRYMERGAALVLTVPGGPMSAFDRHIGHRRHYTPELVRETLSDAGFSVEGVQRAGFPFFNFYRLLVIARGRKLVNDVESQEISQGATGRLARLAMRGFHHAFRFNHEDSLLGWQLVAVARVR